MYGDSVGTAVDDEVASKLGTADGDSNDIRDCAEDTAAVGDEVGGYSHSPEICIKNTILSDSVRL